MRELRNYHANGVSFSEEPRPDASELLERIPDEGTLHLAILQPPYLDLISSGVKTIESRFNTKKAAPFGKVAVGDLVLLKHSGLPVTNYFFAESVQLIDLSEEPIEEIQRRYAEGICAQNEKEFWREKASSTYCTLVGVGDRGSIEPLSVHKKDQRGWVTFTRIT
ncbi:MAG: ASCH domain-containing protein [Candidatus Saccharibacteria bacterium]